MGRGGRGGRQVVKRKGREAYLGLWAVGSFVSASNHIAVGEDYITKGWGDVGSDGRIIAVPQGEYILYSNVLYCTARASRSAS